MIRLYRKQKEKYDSPKCGKNIIYIIDDPMTSEGFNVKRNVPEKVLQIDTGQDMPQPTHPLRSHGRIMYHVIEKQV